MSNHTMNDSQTDATVSTTANGKRNRNLLVVTAVFVALGIAWGTYWFTVASKRERTDDAYIGGDLVYVTARVAGTVTSITGKDMDSVPTGATLVQLDAVDAQTTLQKAASALASAVRQYRQQSETAAQLDAAIATQKLQLARAREDLARREPLVRDQAIAAEELDHARNAVALAETTLAQTERQAKTAHAAIDGTTVRNHPSVLQAKAAYVEAWLNSQRNAVVAPVAGHITQHMVKIGQRIQPGQTLLTIVPLNKVWVDANFKEVQLRKLRIGQPVEVVSDLYGSDVVYHGKVAGIGIGTGAAFSLLPAQNASGNWIKVTQRVPVRIALDAAEVAAHPLRIGLSTETTVDVSDQSGPVLTDEQSPKAHDTTDVYAADLSKVEAEAERIITQQL